MRTDTLFGKTVNVVGNVSADLVLESLGKIYVKSRNSALTLDEVIKSLASGSSESIAEKTIIIEGLDELEGMIIKEGSFVFDKSSLILYILVGGELIELISVSTSDTRYVKKTGDTMTGALTINTQGAPLKVMSSMLNKNLNAEFLNGSPKDAFAQKNKNEAIGGLWTFNNNTRFKAPVYFEDNTMHYQDSLHAGSVGTPDFVSGFGGYGWRIDTRTNTLTIDYIVVRKAMYVYELVVNRIRATNGSLWVTNASKVEHVCNLKIIKTNNAWSFIDPDTSNPDKEVLNVIYGAENDDGFIVTNSIPTLEGIVRGLSSNEIFYNFKDLKVCMCTDKSKLSDLIQNLNNQGDTLNFVDSDFNNEQISDVFAQYDLFDPYFDTDVVMPIVEPTKAWYESNGVQGYSEIKYIKTYYKYFGFPAFASQSNVYDTNLYLVKFDSDYLPVFMPGDILRCQKFTERGIKYYDAVVCNKLNDSYFIILLAPSIFDKTTEIHYDENLNPITTEHVNRDFYDTTGHRSNNILGIVQEGDDIVQIGNLWDVTRQNAVYITSSDDASPYIDTLSGINRPDYSVIYNTPNFETIKLYRGDALPFTGDYYILDNKDTAQYLVAYKDSSYYSLALNKRKSTIYLWYKDGENIRRVPFDDLYDTTKYTDALRELALSNPIRLLEIFSNEIEFPTTMSETELIGKLGNKYNKTFSTTGENPYTIVWVRGYPDWNTKLSAIRITDNLVLETGGTICTEIDFENLFILENEILKPSVVPTRTVKARFGRLDGIIDSRFAKDRLPHGFGLYGENVFLTGEFVLSSGKNVADFNNDFLWLLSGLDQTSKAYADLKTDLLNLAKNTPNYGNLEAAGIFLTDNKLYIYGDSITILTKPNEINPRLYSTDDIPTALFANGKILAKFLEIYEVHNLTEFYSDSNPPNYVKYTSSNADFIGENNVHFYTYKEENSEGKLVDKVDYIRKFTGGGGSFWAKCDIYGEIGNSPEYVEFNGYTWNSASLSILDTGKNSWDTFLEEHNAGEYVEGTDLNIDTYLAYKEFLTHVNAVRLWSLHRDGKGNLGGNSVFWDTLGQLTVTGKVLANSGYIGGLHFNDSNMFAEKPYIEDPLSHDRTYSNYSPISFITTSAMLTTEAGRIASTVKLKMFLEKINNGEFQINRRMILEPSGIMFDDAYALNTGGDPYGFSNRTTVSYDGITMRKNGMDMGVSCVLLNLILIPVVEDDNKTYGLYVRGNASTLADFNSMTAQAFNQIDVYWHSLGRFVISFPGMNDDNEFGGSLTGLSISRWFAENLLNGNIHIQVQGTNIGQLPAGLKVDALNSSGNYYINQDDFELDLGFDCYKINASLDSIVFSSDSTCKFGTSHYFTKGVTYNSENEDTSYYLYYFPVEYFRLYNMSNYVDEEHTSYNMSDSKTLNYLAISTSDSDGLKDGGILLLIIYNNFTNNNIGGTTYVANS